MAVTSPVKSPRRGFVEVPKKEYQAFLLWRNETLAPLPKAGAKVVKAKVKTIPKTKAKKLPSWLQASLRDVKEGRVSGPFDTVEALMADLLS